MTRTNEHIKINDPVHFAGHESIVRDIAERNGELAFLIENGPARLPMWIPEAILHAHQSPNRPSGMFNMRTPDIIAVDNFFHDPDEVRAIALTQTYESNLGYFKGKRSTQRFLWPGLREEFGRLIGRLVTEWLGYNANGVFQLTAGKDPLVWHHDTQRYAAAVYLTPDASPSAGTSFWRSKTWGCRRHPNHPQEVHRFNNAADTEAARGEIYDPYNLEHPDNWELIESVAGLYNRLVIWDAQLIHSATSYDRDNTRGHSRLVQLFFFDV